MQNLWVICKASANGVHGKGPVQMGYIARTFSIHINNGGGTFLEKIYQGHRQRGALGAQAPPSPVFYEIIRKNRELFPKIKSTV